MCSQFSNATAQLLVTAVINNFTVDIQRALTQQFQSISSALRIGLTVTVSSVERYGRCNLCSNSIITQPTKLCLILQMDVKQLRMTPWIQTFHHSHWLGLNPTLVPLIFFLVPVWITLAWVLADPLWPAHVKGISFLKPGGNLWITVCVASQTLLSSCAKLSWYVLYCTNKRKVIFFLQNCACLNSYVYSSWTSKVYYINRRRNYWVQVHWFTHVDTYNKFLLQ